MTVAAFTVADWIAEGETTMSVSCIARECGHHAVLDLTRLPPETTRSQIARRIRCTACGARGGQIMRDMVEHYRRMKERSGFDPTPWPARQG